MSETLTTDASYDESIKVPSPQKLAKVSILFFGGIALSLTGVGAVIGVPMFLWGLFSSTKVKGAWVGDCPKCGKTITWTGGKETAQGELDCPSCKVHLTFYSGQFSHTPPVQ